MNVSTDNPLIAASEIKEAEAISRLDHLLDGMPEAGTANMTEPQGGVNTAGPSRPVLVGVDGSQVEIPPSVCRILRDAVHHLAQGEAVSLVSRPQELTTQQAAEILNISRPYLIRLLERDEIPYRRVGTHRRVALEDVLAYREQRARKRREALDRLTEKSQDLGLY
ncbi:MAG TPA: helix-turn-helix domain-containing protein [Chloroflexota bacterium]|nr:helix-turn-helix domain-containing protein [Chloroflexota bacterium]